MGQTGGMPMGPQGGQQLGGVRPGGVPGGMAPGGLRPTGPPPQNGTGNLFGNPLGGRPQ